ncbi:MAG: beta-propeller domain-containing protein [Oscillospiraceae bacterium]|nr:beta-propeller domain-containing protein [Oscillospiraceae bacterium]
MTSKRIAILCLILAVLSVGMLTLISVASGSLEKENDIPISAKPLPAMVADLMGLFKPTANIKSDGKTYTLKTINVVPVVSTVPEGEHLPVVGDRETLLKLLIDKGALYDNSTQKRGRISAWGVMEDGAVMGIDDAVESGALRPSANAPDIALEAQAPPMAPPAPPDSAWDEAEMDPNKTESSDEPYSKTNEQTKGVNEGDIVKTDGQYIYALSQDSNTLRIIKADGKKLEVVSTIQLTDLWGTEFYLIDDDRLAIIGCEYVPIEDICRDVDVDDKPFDPDTMTDIAPYGWYQNNFTVLEIYDISIREAPELSRRVSMDGNSVSTRVIGSVVYLATNKQIWSIPYDEADSPAILPYYCDTLLEGNFEPINFDSIYYIPDSIDASYLLIGAIDVYSDAEFEPEAYLGASSNLYMSRSAMYVTQNRWEQSVRTAIPGRENDFISEKTDILRFSVSGTDVTYAGMGTVDGSPINQYSMDEYDGYFRIATTSWEAGTFVTVLKTSTMRTVGRTEPLAPGERMQSARFNGDMGYVVTFQNMDPLFTIDLRDPNNPKVLGELKIPGFSQYLHMVGEGIVLGIGRDVQETYTRDANGAERVVGIRDVGIKASLFDVSNPFDPKEIDVLALGEGWAEVSSNPRALMCDSERGLYGFMVERWDNAGNWFCGAVVLRVEDGQLLIDATLKPNEYLSQNSSRLCFIGNTLYLVHGSGVIAYDYSSYARLASISF